MSRRGSGTLFSQTNPAPSSNRGLTTQALWRHECNQSVRRRSSDGSSAKFGGIQDSSLFNSLTRRVFASWRQERARTSSSRTTLRTVRSERSSLKKVSALWGSRVVRGAGPLTTLIFSSLLPNKYDQTRVGVRG